MFLLKQPLNSTLLIVSIALSTISLKAQDGKVLYKMNCAACHTIGGGVIVGPDLKGISALRDEEWLIKWIESSQTMINSGDSLAIQLFNDYHKIPMPDQSLTREEILAVLDYIDVKGGTGGAKVATVKSTEPQEPVRSSEGASVEEILLGQHLFEGGTRLANGGPACISCHNVATNRVIPGGLLAKDLTTVFSRMGGDAGLTGIMNAPPFPAMTESYKNKPLTKDEIFATAAFLRSVEEESKTDSAATATNPLLLYGFIGFVIWILIVLLIWARRKKYAVSKRIYQRQVKSY